MKNEYYKLENIEADQISDFFFGTAEDPIGKTGLTLVLSTEGAVASCDVRGGGPATRETDLLEPENMVEKINGVLLSGGSSYGLNSVQGVMEALEEKGIGFDVGVGVVPIVCGASIFDLAYGDCRCRPDSQMGREVANASLKRIFKTGSHGAGCGATCGKILGMDYSAKSGQGFCGYRLGELYVAAIAVVNPLGDIIEKNGKVLKGTDFKRSTSDGIHQITYDSTLDYLIKCGYEPSFAEDPCKNTTISCIVTNGKLTKAQCKKAASVAHDGYSRAINPVHTSMDGDTVFFMSSGKIEAGFDLIAQLGALAVEEAIRNSILI